MLSQNTIAIKLLEFDPKLHYFKISENKELIRCNKADLKWGYLFIRKFWKPECERISIISNNIFSKINNQTADQLLIHPDKDQLRVLFKNLSYFAEKAENKGYPNFKNIAFDLQNIVYGKLFHMNEIEAQKRKNKNLQSEITEKETKLSQLNEWTKRLIRTVNSVNLEITAQEEAMTRHLKYILERSLQKKILESDTILWTNDGYLLCSSTIFSKESLVNNPQFANMPISPEIENQLSRLSDQTSAALRSFKKQLYIETATIQQLKSFVTILEIGPTAINGFTDKNYLAICEIGNYLQQKPLPEKENPVIKSLTESHKKQLKQLRNDAQHTNQVHEEEISRLQGIISTNCQSTLSKKLESLIKNLRIITNENKILTNIFLSDKFKSALQKVLYFKN